ncbi:efflux transporter outer membrane subunit [Paracidovorax citrulli]
MRRRIADSRPGSPSRLSPLSRHIRHIRQTRLAGALALALLTGACAVGPDYQRPDAPLTPAFKEAPAEWGQWKPATPQDAAHRGPWWAIFNDPRLDTLMAQVQVSNQTVRAAEAQYRQAIGILRGARAGQFPLVSVQGSAGRARGSTGSVGSSQAVSLGASWELDLWGRIRRQVESSGASAQASQADLASTLLSTQATLAQTYFLLRITDAQQALLQRTVADYQRSLQLVTNQYRAGIAQRSDVLQAENQLKSAQAQLIDIQIDRAQYEHALAVLTGQPPAAFDLAAGNFTVSAASVPQVPVAVPSQLLERRPDISSAERRMAAANAAIGIAQAAFYPTLSLSATAGLTAGSLDRWLALPDRIWSFGPQLAATLFDAGARSAAREQAVAVYDETVANYRQTVLNAFQEVEDNLAAARLLEQEAVVQNEALQAAREASELVTNRYRAGTASLLEVLTAQTAAYTAERTALSLLGRQLTASVTLVAALGGGWEGPQAVAGVPSDRTASPAP